MKTPRIGTGPTISLAFQPPDMKRIPTRPIFGGDGGVKDKLTDFSFNYQRLGAPTQGGGTAHPGQLPK
jgi:hypothetical protein